METSAQYRETSAQYREFAEECDRLAEQAKTDGERKIGFVHPDPSFHRHKAAHHSTGIYHTVCALLNAFEIPAPDQQVFK